MTIIQIFIIFFAVFAIIRTVRQFHRGVLTRMWLLFWILFWTSTGIVAALPQTTDVIAKFVGVGRGADVVIYVSLLALFYLVFRLYVKIEQVEGEITRLVRKLSLDDLDEDV